MSHPESHKDTEPKSTFYLFLCSPAFPADKTIDEIPQEEDSIYLRYLSTFSSIWFLKYDGGTEHA